MIKEILIKDKAISLEDLNSFVDLASSYQIDNICLPSFFLPYVKCEGLSIASQIDFPYGLSSTKTRVKEVIYSCDSGAQVIDLTINPFLMANDSKDKIIDEIKIINDICKDKRKSLRCIIEYRLFDSKFILDFCDELYKNKVDSVICSTGTMSDVFDDACLIAAYLSEMTPMNIIISSSVRTKKDYEELKKFKVGVRSSDKFVIKDIFGVL